GGRRRTRGAARTYRPGRPTRGRPDVPGRRPGEAPSPPRAESPRQLPAPPAGAALHDRKPWPGMPPSRPFEPNRYWGFVATVSTKGPSPGGIRLHQAEAGAPWTGRRDVR